MIECWRVKAPEPEWYITKVVKLDMTLFSASILAMSDKVGALRGDGTIVGVSGYTTSHSMPYLVEFNDGTIARSNGNTLIDALDALGQVKPW